ncbi:methyltransferase domain-containing protein [Candidatus Omnitrophota bacterium]
MKESLDNKRVLWEDFWQKGDFSAQAYEKIIKEIIFSVYWNKISSRVLSRFGSFKGLKTVEIGCGMAETSLLFAREGAEVTVIDYSPKALYGAESLFGYFNLQATFLSGDIFSLPQGLLERFDIAMSYGLAEHFRYPERRSVFEVHYSLAKIGGMLLVGVPNAWCLPYRIFKVLAQWLGYWKVGLEIPFSRRELSGLAESLRLKDCRILGPSFLHDFYYFLLSRPLKKLSGQRIKFGGNLWQIPSILDDYLGSSLLLSAVK